MDYRRKKLLFQSQHRGMKENDILLGNFAEEVLGDLCVEDLLSFEELLSESDQDIYNWVTEREPLPEHLDNKLLAALIDFNKVK